MKYIFYDFEGIKSWIEIGNDGYARRQVNINADETLVSCRDNCLAEKTISDTAIDTEIENCERIAEIYFEEIWSNSTEKYRQIWGEEKQKYAIGQNITGIIKYFYTQGAIIDAGSIQGCGDVSSDKSIRFFGQEISGTISGFDDKNMWILFDNCKLVRCIL